MNKIYSKEAKEIKKIKMWSMKLKTEKQQKTSMSKKLLWKDQQNDKLLANLRKKKEKTQITNTRNGTMENCTVYADIKRIIKECNTHF